MLLVLNSSPNQEKVFPITNLMVMKIDIKCASIFFSFFISEAFYLYYNIAFFKNTPKSVLF